jgi:hypothetical protein
MLAAAVLILRLTVRGWSCCERMRVSLFNLPNQGVRTPTTIYLSQKSKLWILFLNRLLVDRQLNQTN